MKPDTLLKFSYPCQLTLYNIVRNEALISWKIMWIYHVQSI